MAKILVIDDEPGVRLTLKVMLESQNHEVLTAENGRVGLDLFEAQSENIDLVITDILMPEIDGLQIIREVRDSSTDIPVIAISGGGNKIAAQDPLQAAKEIAQGVIRKPFNSSQLYDTVNSCLT